MFQRGDPEPVAVTRQSTFDAKLYDLLSAYAAQRQKQMVTRVHVRRRTVWALADARDILERLIGPAGDWAPIETFLRPYITTAELRPTVRASAFSASLELVREGKMELRQAGPFQPIWIRAPRPGEADDAPPEGAS